MLKVLQGRMGCLLAKAVLSTYAALLYNGAPIFCFCTVSSEYISTHAFKMRKSPLTI